VTLLPLSGRARVLGDDVDTDAIVSSRRKKDSIDPDQLRRFLLEGIDANFASTVRRGDILVAGRNFGCGSAMEVAATVVKAAGFAAVIAGSFSRTYLRNAINNGLLPLTADTSDLREGDPLHLSINPAGIPELRIGASGPIRCEPLPGWMWTMLEAGGLVPYLRQHGGFAAPGVPPPPLA